jgi:4-hydroxythreonine-4-phosphate dehydrogenase
LDGEITLVEPAPGDEPVEVRSLRVAVEACLAGRARAIVTGPIHKARLARQGFPHPGHTEFLAALCGVESPVMAFVGGRVRVALVTVHVPLRDVSARLSVNNVLHTIRLADRALRERLALPAPRLAVCGPNPHAGDEGVIGDDEVRVIAPAIAQARGEGIDARGPMSTETAFRAAVRNEVDLVVAAYHDQGLGPLKALAAASESDHAVNWTLGLPIVRTSVDHGTAHDIAGKGVADPGSMLAALALAERLTAPA